MDSDFPKIDDINENQYSERLTCSKSTKDLILKNCTTIFLKEHPEFKGINISQGFILRRIAEYYLK